MSECALCFKLTTPVQVQAQTRRRKQPVHKVFRLRLAIPRQVVDFCIEMMMRMQDAKERASVL
eukprot:245755-Pelagomonas_calceolata.AAC.1